MTRPTGDADPSQAEVIAFLRRPDSYGGAVTDVESISTHAAVVFLAGDRAYKMKRAVRYTYLDYSTLALRRRACEREVALNRRTAPEVYLDTQPVVRMASGDLCIGGDGEPIEWLVVMRRFDQAELFDRLAAAGLLTRDMVEGLADRLAEFHQSAAPATSGTHGGGNAGLAWVVEENIEALRQRADLFAPASVDALNDRAKSALCDIAALLDQRLADGLVRDCHGDLHLSNVCRIDGAPVIFDCIEFNDRISRIDVLYDLAFLLMDLINKGLVAHANAVLNRYMRRTSDYAGLAALPLFLSQRAAVRAHVRASAEALAEGEAHRTSHGEAARRYFDAASAFLSPAAPILAAVGGFSGSGKTTFAREFAPKVGPAPGAIHLRSDVIRKALYGYAEKQRLPEQAYDMAASEAVYGKMMEIAETCLAAGHAVICDAVHARESERVPLSRLAERYGARFAGYWLEAPVEELVRRVGARSGDASDATADVVRRQTTSGAGHITWSRIDATEATERTVESALRQIPPSCCA